MTEIFLYGEIGGLVDPREVAEAVAAADQAAPILARINSPGGSVLDGEAIIGALRRHPQNFHAVVDGMAFSMAAIIAISADHLTMPADAWLMFHRAASQAGGSADDHETQSAVLRKMDEMQMRRIREKAPAAAALVAEIEGGADVYLDGAQALAAGLVDELTPAAAIAACRTGLPNLAGIPAECSTYLDKLAPDNTKGAGKLTFWQFSA
tara:strand:+ start:1489 stop:2115 length:627 start_codon:yes stop_codon:yes gene_type:complete